MPFARHHGALLDMCEGLAKGTLLDEYGAVIKNGMVFMPPGSAKSTYGSVVFPTWYMGWKRQSQIILASYASNIARKQGRRARQIARSRKFQLIWEATLRGDTTAADEWALTNASEFMAGGILSGVTGNRAHGLVIDDPVSGRQDADSPTVRKSTREAYEDDLLTRLVPGAWQLLIQTRWNQDDLAGGILPADWAGESGDIQCRDGQTWRILCLPAEARENDPLGRAPGELLWAEWFTQEHFKRYKANARTWSALFQQLPMPEEGDYFKREWIKTDHGEPMPPLSHLKLYIGSDYAVTDGAGDWTVHVVIGVDKLGRLWLVDIWREQAASDAWVEAYCDLVALYKPSQTAEETGQIKGSVGPFLLKRMRARKVHTWRQTFPTKGSKGERAQSIRGQMSMDGLYVNPDLDPEKLAAFIAELLLFPGGKTDDQVDALGLVGQLLDRIANGKEPVGLDAKPKALEYVGDPDTGASVPNMTVKEQVWDFVRRQRAKRGEDEE